MAGSNFGDTILQSQITPEVQPLSPVDDKSGQYLAAAAGDALQGVGTIFGGIVKQGMQNQANGVLNDYRIQTTRIADAVDQGGLSLQAARTRLRKLYTDTLSNNPSLGKEIDSLHSKLMDEYGIGSVIKAGNEQTQREQKLADTAYQAGWVTPDGSPDTVSFQRYQTSVTQAETTLRDIQVRTAQRGEVSALDKQKLDQSIHAMAEAGYPWVEAQVQQAAKLIDQDPSSAADVIQKLEADVNAQLNQFTTASGGEDIAYIVKPMQDLVSQFKDMATGKTSTDILKTQMDANKARMEYTLRSDPDVAKVLSVSELFGQNAGPIVEQKLSLLSAKIFGDNLKSYDENSDTNSKPADVINTDGNTKAYFDTLGQSMDKALTGGSPTPEVTQEVSTSLTNVLRGITSYNADSVKDYRNVVDFYASPSVEKWVASGKAIVPKGVQDKAKQVIQDQYQNVLLPVVSDAWDNATVTVSDPSGSFGISTGGSYIAKPLSISEVIDPVWNGSSVSFQPKPEWANNPIVVGKAKALNTGDNSIAGPLNTLIRAKAHMGGTNDYTSEWNEISTHLFGGPDGEPEDTESPDDVGSTSLNDFNSYVEPTYINNSALDAIDSISRPSEGPLFKGVDISSLPAGMRNNNPGNIKFSARNNWKGQVGPSKNTDQGDPQVVFSSPEDGMRAMGKLILKKYGQGLTTIRKLVTANNGWTPGYTAGAQGVAKAAGIDIDAPLNLRDPNTLAAVMRGIVTQEHGPASKLYPDSLILKGVQSALYG